MIYKERIEYRNNEETNKASCLEKSNGREEYRHERKINWKSYHIIEQQEIKKKL
jgi:hypothetical protein